MLSSETHAERKRMLANLYSKSNVQLSPEITSIYRTILSGRMMTELRHWAHDSTIVDVLETNKACMMDLTTAWFFGLDNGTNLLQNHTAAHEIFTAFGEIPTFVGFFWLTELSTITRFLQRIGIHLLPKAAFSSQHLIQQWCSEMCEAARSTAIQLSVNEKPARTTYPVVYTHLRQGLEKSN